VAEKQRGNFLGLIKRVITLWIEGGAEGEGDQRSSLTLRAGGREKKPRQGRADQPKKPAPKKGKFPRYAVECRTGRRSRVVEKGGGEKNEREVGGGRSEGDQKKPVREAKKRRMRRQVLHPKKSLHWRNKRG